jgi:hypothetical protein
MREWVEGIPNRIRVAGALRPRGDRLALMDARGRVVAVFHQGEILIPDPHILTPEQAEGLLDELEGGMGQIEVEGNPTLLDKIETGAVARGLMGVEEWRAEVGELIEAEIEADQELNALAMRM